VTTLAILWVYGTGLALRWSWQRALIAAGALGLSWELAYHSRWAVTDGPLLQFAALTMMFTALHYRTGKTSWLWAAAVAAGFGLGTKYPGLFMTGSVLLAGGFTIPFRHNLKAQVWRAARIGMLVFAVYIVTTPATLIDPIEFIIQTRDISSYYAKTHYGYTATSAWNHAGIFLSYLSLSFFSPYLVPALLAFLVAVLGIVAFVRDDRRLAAIIIACPVIFIISFCIKYRVVVVRNTLYLTPMLALMFSRGIGQIGDWIRNIQVRRVLAGALGAAMLAQAVWLIWAAEGIRHVSMNVQAKQAVEYVARHPKERYRLTPRIRSLAVEAGAVIPPNVVADNKMPAGHVVFFARGEGPVPYVWKVNDRWLTEAIFGPKEVDFNWYSTWSGHDRIVVMDINKARSFGVDIAK